MQAGPGPGGLGIPGHGGSGLAENGLEALELIKSREPDILITDIRMPGCDGLELIRSAKELMPDLEVVIISGYAHFEYAQKAMKYGAGYYLLKPIKQTELMETLVKIRKNARQDRKPGRPSTASTRTARRT